MVDFKKALANAQKHWKGARKRVSEDTGGFQEYDDGRYLGRLVSAKIGQSQSSNRLQVDFGWKFEDGQYEGKIKHNYQGLETEDNLFFLGRDLEKLGYELPDDLTELPAILADIEKSKPMADIVLKTKGDFQNLYVRKVYSGDDDEEEASDEEAAEGDEPEADEEETDEDAAEESDGDAEEDADEDEDADEAAEADEEEADDEEDEPAEEDDEEGVDITVGMRVQVETAKGREAGEIITILEDEGKVRVKLDNDKIVKVGAEKVEIEDEPAEEEGDEEEEAPPAKKKVAAPAKKTAPAPAKKTAPPVKKKAASAPVKKSGPVKKGKR